MEKGGKCTVNNKCEVSVQEPECEKHLSFPQCSFSLRASSDVMVLENKGADAKLASKSVLRKKRKKKSKNVRRKAVTTESHQEISAQERSPCTRLKKKKQKACQETLRDSLTPDRSVTTGQKSDSQVDKVSLRSKVSLKAWPSRSYRSKKDCSEVIVKRNKRRNCLLFRNCKIPGHSCYDFTNRSTVQTCCLSSERGSWVSADPRNQSHAKLKRANPQVVDQQEIKKAPPKTVSAPSTSNESSGHLELPGFYYDPDKKRYFKIVPSSNNCMSNVVTRERIAFDRNEKLRQEELKSLAATGQLKDPSHQTTVRKSVNILSLIGRRQQGLVEQEVSNYQLRRSCVAKLQPHAVKATRFLLDSPGVIIKKMKIQAQENKLFVCSSTDAEMYISVMKIKRLRVFPNESDSSVDRSFAVQLRRDTLNLVYDCRLGRVTDFCFADADCSLLSTSTILYCTNNSLVNASAIRVFQCTRSRTPLYWHGWDQLVNSVRKSYLMCCASTSNVFAVGAENCVFLGRYEKDSAISELCTSNTAIYALTFANTTSNVLFCAAKSGRILMYDELSSKQKPAACLTESEGFSFDLYMTKDDRYLLSAKSNAQRIEKWDLRQGRVVVDYPGHISECARTPLVVDQNEEFLSAVGSDSYTRIWDLKTGELMKVLPPPLPATKENMPSVCFVDLYGQSRNNYPGLLLGMSNRLHFYSL